MHSHLDGLDEVDFDLFLSLLYKYSVFPCGRSQMLTQILDKLGTRIMDQLKGRNRGQCGFLCEIYRADLHGNLLNISPVQHVSNFPHKSTQALTADPERGIRVEELERLLAVETGGDEFGADENLLDLEKDLFCMNGF